MTLQCSKNSKIIYVEMLNSSIVCITSKKQFDVFIAMNKAAIERDSSLSIDELTDAWQANGASIRIVIEGQVYFALFLRNTNHVTAAHECVHMSGQIMKYKGIPTKLSNDETRAYLTGYLFKELCKAAKLTIIEGD